jgi:RNA polymerase sigma factor (sigma-70 family)
MIKGFAGRGSQMLSHDDMVDIMDQYGTYLTQISYMYVKNWTTAEDIVQETFIVYFKKPEKFHGQSTLKTYLTKICMNKSLDSLRSFKAKATTIMRYFKEQEEASTSPIDVELVGRIEKTELFQEVLKLPIKYREVIILYYYEDMTSSAISELMNIPEGTVKSRLKRGRERLKMTLQTDFLEVDFIE